MYLSMFDHAVNAVLVRIERSLQKLVYYVSKTLLEAEDRYLPFEKVALALVPPGNYHTTFQARMVIVSTKHQLQVVLRRANFSGRVENWRLL